MRTKIWKKWINILKDKIKKMKKMKTMKKQQAKEWGADCKQKNKLN
jgi:hypothetical protein